MLTAIKSMLPKPMRTGLRKCQSLAIRLFSNPMVPPKEAIFVGDSDFVATGNEFLRHFVELGGLQPTDHVLDVGSGQGRMALPLTRYLDANSKYVGIEIVRHGVTWCQEKYRRFPNFQFVHADIFNKAFNRDGAKKRSEYQFPFRDASFDFVFLTSVFTHMGPEEMQHYLAEISRCMRVGGRCLITCFLLNPESMALIQAGRSTLHFDHEVFSFCRTINPDNFEQAIAFPESFIRESFTRNGLHVKVTRYGRWVPRENFLSYQDIIVAEKRAA